MTFTKQIILGLVLRLFIGVFLGEFASSFSIAGNVYIARLQMTVLDLYRGWTCWKRQMFIIL